MFGSDPLEGLVGVEPVADDRVRLFVRTPQGLRAEDDALRPFLWLEGPDLLTDWTGPADLETLAGTWDFRTIAFFPGWKTFEAALRHLKRATGKPPGARDAPYFFFPDPVQQYLCLTGRTLYKGLGFEDLHRLQLDIETAVSEGFEFPNAEREGDRITLVSLSDSTGWETSLRGDRLSEAEIIRELGRVIRERDPDVLEGHNLFNFDIPYLRARARRCAGSLAWGRDGSPVRTRPSRFSAAERVISYERCDVHGRQVIDTLFLVQLYDVATRELEGFGLKAVARHLGVAPENRVYVDPRDISGLAESDMDRLVAYGLDDVRETREISRILGQSHFHQTQMFPLSHQNTVTRGTATRIDALFLREYLRRRHSVPRPPVRAEFAGGYTDLLATGILSPVVHCDVQSLYPSVMLAFSIQPARDTLGVFPSLLGDLTARRLKAKARTRAAHTTAERTFFEALQAALKVLINSFYGYLGFPQGHFADFEAAARVTAEGRALIHRVIQTLETRGARPIEVDTDGVYFVPPPGVAGDEPREEEFVASVSGALPDAIHLEMAGRYRSMFSYRVKNYVLLTYGGEVRIRGSGLRSRGMEKFQRQFLEELFRAVLGGQRDHGHRLRDRFLDDLRHHRWTPELFAKTETLHDSLAVYQEKRRQSARSTSAAYELALASGRPFRRGDQVTYYVAGQGARVQVFEAAKLATEWDPEHPDENVEYYAKKLDDLFRKFRPLVDDPAPDRQGELALGD
ncbi:MAG: DNA polymerase II [Deltaproteobacteria bacterium]|nr:DNA polymerase II [Deltaproteobacteria bacterium]